MDAEAREAPGQDEGAVSGSAREARVLRVEIREGDSLEWTTCGGCARPLQKIAERHYEGALVMIGPVVVNVLCPGCERDAVPPLKKPRGPRKCGVKK